MQFMRKSVLKYLTVILGFYVLSLGVVLFVKSSLGTTPISCINYVLSLHTPLTLGSATFVFNVVLILIEMMLIRGIGTKRDRIEILLQVPFSALLGFFMDLNMRILAPVEVDSYPMAVGFVLAGCVTQALGVVLELKPNVAIMSAEGVVKYSSRRWNRDFGRMKVAFDITLVTIAAILSFAWAGHVEGLREGTVVAAVCTGFIVSAMIRYIFTPTRIHRITSVLCGSR